MPIATVPPPPWKPGDPYRWAIVEACPECGGTIFRADKTVGRRVRWKVCKTCGEYIKRVGDDLASKAHLVGLPPI